MDERVQEQKGGVSDAALLSDERTEGQESWGFAEGDQIAPGISVLRMLGRARRYETYLAWHDTMLSVVVVKILRPDRVTHGSALEGLADEARALGELDHPVLMRSFGAVLEGPRP